jgi:hypothetical protein
MPKGNKKAHGKMGNKGGTGRPPKPESERRNHKLYLGVNDALYEKIMSATLEACFNDYQDFLRFYLEKSL